LQFGDLKLLIGKAVENYVVTLHASDDEEARDHNQQVIQMVSENEDDIDDGFLALINEMISKEETPEEEKERVRRGIRGFTSEAGSKAKKWGEKVF
jgi:hypothetical protein